MMPLPFNGARTRERDEMIRRLVDLAAEKFKAGMNREVDRPIKAWQAVVTRWLPSPKAARQGAASRSAS